MTAASVQGAQPGEGLRDGRLRGGLRRVDAVLQKILVLLCIVLTAVMLATVAGQVVMRYAFNSPLSWSEELARFAMIWMAFAAGALAFRKGLHIKLEGMTLVPRRFAGQAAAMVRAIVLAILLALLYFGWQITMRTLTQHSPALGVSMAWIYFSIPFSCACMVFFAVLGWLFPVDEDRPAAAVATPA